MKTLEDVKTEVDALTEAVNDSGAASSIGCIAFGGSIAYGLDDKNSDVDLRGFYLPSVRDILLLTDSEQVERHDDIVDGSLFSAAKLLRLLTQNNPNVMELLGLRPEHVLVTSPAYQMILDNKHLFVSRKSANTFGGYAMQQMRRIKNSVSRDKGDVDSEGALRSMKSAMLSFSERYAAYTDGSIELALGDMSQGAKGITMTANLSEIPVNQFRGIINDLDDIGKNADNLAARNRKKDTAHLSKHMSHLVRLLRMGTEMLETGAVNTYRENDAELLKEIKHGKWIGEDENGVREIDGAFWELVDEENERFTYAKKNTELPEDADRAAVDELLVEMHRSVLAGE